MSSEGLSIIGFIKAVSPSEAGPASGFRYVIRCNYPVGNGQVAHREFTNQQPSEARYPDTVDGEPFHCEPYPVGAAVCGFVDRGMERPRIYWWFHELPSLGLCATDGGNLGGNLLPNGVNLPTLPPPGGGGGGGPQSAPGPGGSGEGGTGGGEA